MDRVRPDTVCELIKSLAFVFLTDTQGGLEAMVPAEWGLVDLVDEVPDRVPYGFAAGYQLLLVFLDPSHSQAVSVAIFSHQTMY